MKRSFKLVLTLGLLGMLILNLSVYAAPQTTLRFMWWGSDTRHRATLNAIEQYMKENPNVKISGEYSGFNGYQQKLLTQLAGNTAADIIQIDQPWVVDLMSQGDLFADMRKLKDLQLSGFDKNLLANQCSYKGKLVGLPTGLNGLIFIANSDFLAKHKISPSTKWDWDNLLEIGTKVHRDNPKNYLVTGGSMLHTEYLIKMHVKQHTGIQQWVNDDYTIGFTKDSLTKAFAYYQKLLQTGTMPPLEESILFNEKEDQDPKWANGEIGMVQNWVSTVLQYNLNGRLNVTPMPVPMLKGAKNSGIIVRPSQLLVINSKSPNVREAAKFVSWFFNNPNAILALKSERGIPPTKAGVEVLAKNQLLDPNMANGINMAVKNGGIPENGLTSNKELITIFDDYIQKIGFKRVTPEEAAEMMIRDFKAKLVELKNQK